MEELAPPPDFTSVLLTSEDLLPSFLWMLDFYNLARMAATCSLPRPLINKMLSHVVTRSEPITPPPSSWLLFSAVLSDGSIIVPSADGGGDVGDANSRNRHLFGAMHIRSAEGVWRTWVRPSRDGSVEDFNRLQIHDFHSIAARFDPRGLCGDGDRLFVIDGEDTAVYEVTPEHLEAELIGYAAPREGEPVITSHVHTPGSANDEDSFPMGIAFSPATNRLFVVLSDYHQVVGMDLNAPRPQTNIIDRNGSTIPPGVPSLVLGSPHRMCGPPEGFLNNPYDCAVYEGNVYVTDAGNNRIAVFNEVNGRWVAKLRIAKRICLRPDMSGIDFAAGGQIVLGEHSGKVHIFAALTEDELSQQVVWLTRLQTFDFGQQQEICGVCVDHASGRILLTDSEAKRIEVLIPASLQTMGDVRISMSGANLWHLPTSDLLPKSPILNPPPPPPPPPPPAAPPPDFTSVLLTSDDLLPSFLWMLDFISLARLAATCSLPRPLINKMLSHAVVDSGAPIEVPLPEEDDGTESWILFVSVLSDGAIVVSNAPEDLEATAEHTVHRPLPGRLHIRSADGEWRMRTRFDHIIGTQIDHTTYIENPRGTAVNGDKFFVVNIDGAVHQIGPASFPLQSTKHTELVASEFPLSKGFPLGMAFSPATNRLFVVYSDHHRVVGIDLNDTPEASLKRLSISTDQRRVALILGSGEASDAKGSLRDPFDCAVYKGYVYVTDSANNRISVFDEVDGKWVAHLKAYVSIGRQVANGGIPGTISMTLTTRLALILPLMAASSSPNRPDGCAYSSRPISTKTCHAFVEPRVFGTWYQRKCSNSDPSVHTRSVPKMALKTRSSLVYASTVSAAASLSPILHMIGLRCLCLRPCSRWAS